MNTTSACTVCSSCIAEPDFQDSFLLWPMTSVRKWVGSLMHWWLVVLTNSRWSSSSKPKISHFAPSFSSVVRQWVSQSLFSRVSRMYWKSVLRAYEYLSEVRTYVCTNVRRIGDWRAESSFLSSFFHHFFLQNCCQTRLGTYMVGSNRLALSILQHLNKQVVLSRFASL